MAEKRLLIYGLSDPDTGELRYVGRTCRGLNTRLAEHNYSAKNKRNNYHLYCWMRSLEKSPLIEMIEDCGTDMDYWFEAETYWISQFKFLGFDLTNHSDGGNKGNLGSTYSKEARIKISRSNGGKSFTDNLGNLYTTVVEAAKALDLHESGITGVLKGRYKHSGGYTFSYVNDMVGT